MRSLQPGENEHLEVAVFAQSAEIYTSLLFWGILTVCVTTNKLCVTVERPALSAHLQKSFWGYS